MARNKSRRRRVGYGKFVYQPPNHGPSPFANAHVMVTRKRAATENSKNTDAPAIEAPAMATTAAATAITEMENRDAASPVEPAVDKEATVDTTGLDYLADLFDNSMPPPNSIQEEEEEEEEEEEQQQQQQQPTASLPPPRAATVAARPSPQAVTTVQPPVLPPAADHVTAMTRDNTALKTAVYHNAKDRRQSNTENAYDPKKKEFEIFCENLYGHENATTKHLVTPNKVYNFIFYQAHREKKKRGRRNGRLSFDVDDYNRVISRYGTRNNSNASEWEQPKNPLQFQQINTYKSAIMEIHSEQVANNANRYIWDHDIWNIHCRKLYDYVKARKATYDRKNYKEKIDTSFSFFKGVGKAAAIEEVLWAKASNPSLRFGYPALRNRFVFVWSKGGILRCESIYKADLSDTLHVEHQAPKDPHRWSCLVMQIALGKTNHGTNKQYGRAMRHSDVRMCGLGAYSFYLALRFFMTQEFTFIPQDFFCDKKNWFDIKMLVDYKSDNITAPMSSDSYSKAMAGVLKQCGIVTNHIIHLGRVLGSGELELRENELSGILDMGNWEQGTHKRHYSVKMPIKTLRVSAGFLLADGMYFNVRSTVFPDDASMLEKVFPFDVKAHLAFVKAKKASSPSAPAEYLNTAISFLELLEHLQLVFVQDAAAMLVLHPERKDMILYQQHPLLKSEDFSTFVTKMKRALETANSPLDHNLESVLPGVHSRLGTLETGLQQNTNATNGTTSAIASLEAKIFEQHTAMMNAFSRAASAFLVGGHNGQGASTSIAAAAAVINVTNTTTTEESIDDLVKDFVFCHNHKSVRTIYDEYFGLNEFKDKPIAGGLDAMEKKYKNKWRKNIKGSEQHICRMKTVMKAIHKLMDGDDSTVDDVIEKELDPIFIPKEQANKKLSNFARILKERNIVPKAKARGKNCNNNS